MSRDDKAVLAKCQLVKAWVVMLEAQVTNDNEDDVCIAACNVLDEAKILKELACGEEQ